MYQFGKSSLEKLSTVDPKLQRVMMRAIELSTVDFSILEGVRTRDRQYQLYAKGRSVAELRKAGVPSRVLAQPGEKKVTWTLNSKHFPPEEGKPGRAIDTGVFPYDNNAGEKEYRPIRDAVMKAASEQKVRIRWGGDWNMNDKTEHGENDFGHFELA